MLCFSNQHKINARIQLNKDDNIEKKIDNYDKNDNHIMNNNEKKIISIESKNEVNSTDINSNNVSNQLSANNTFINIPNNTGINLNQQNNSFTSPVRPSQPELYKPSIMIPAVKPCPTPIVRPLVSQTTQTVITQPTQTLITQPTQTVITQPTQTVITQPTQTVINQPIMSQHVLEQPMIYQVPARVMTSHEVVPQQTVMQVVEKKLSPSIITTPTVVSNNMVTPLQKPTSVTPGPLMNTPLLRQNGRIVHI